MKAKIWEGMSAEKFNFRVWRFTELGDRFLSSAGAGKNCALSIRFPDRSPVLDKNRAPMGPEILSSTGAGAWRKAPMAFPDSSSVLDTFQSAMNGLNLFSELPSLQKNASPKHSFTECLALIQ